MYMFVDIFRFKMHCLQHLLIFHNYKGKVTIQINCSNQQTGFLTTGKYQTFKVTNENLKVEAVGSVFSENKMII